VVLQEIWAAVLVLPRTYDATTGKYGTCTATARLRISAALIFYILTIAGVFRLRATAPRAEPLQGLRYPVVPALYILGAFVVLLVLFLYRTSTTWPGLIIVSSRPCSCVHRGSTSQGDT